MNQRVVWKVWIEALKVKVTLSDRSDPQVIFVRTISSEPLNLSASWSVGVSS